MANSGTRSVFGSYQTQASHPAYITGQRIPVRMPQIAASDEFDIYDHKNINSKLEIRLVVLLPPRLANDDALIKCNIITCRLADAPEYECLSYTWDALQPTIPIQVAAVNGTPSEATAILITPQLTTALRRFRLADGPRILWADQLCISQVDEEEKAAQIQLMPEIYRRAKQVLVWLGEAPESHWAIDEKGKYSTESDVELLRTMLEIVNARPGGMDIDDLLARELVEVYGTCYHFDTLKLRRWRALSRLLNRPWFTRAWVFQEASLAREIVLQYGSLVIPIEALYRLCRAVSRLEKQYGIDGLEYSTPGHDMLHLVYSAQQNRLPWLENTATAAEQRPQGLLCTLLAVNRRTQCSRQHDRIFALLAFQLAEGISASPDSYARPAEEIWRDAAERIIRSTSSLAIFAAASGGVQRDIRLPSWVPDWDNPFPYSCPIATPLTHFKASKNRPHVWTPHENPAKLQCSGTVVDRIKMFLSPKYRDFLPAYDNIKLFLHWAVLYDGTPRTLRQFDLKEQYDTKCQRINDELLRTLLADGANRGRRLSSDEIPLLRIVFERDGEAWQLLLARRSGKKRSNLSQTEAELLSVYHQVNEMARVAQGKRIFFTDGVQLGMAAACAAEGDFIAIIHGSPTPCVLRPVDEAAHEYRLICQCYLDGWMYSGGILNLPHAHAKWWNEDSQNIVLV